MADWEFRRASVLVFDPIGPNLLATRSMLSQIGFTAIDSTRDFQSAVRLMHDNSYELLVLEASDAGADVCDLVKRLRAGLFGFDPFVPVILTSWERSSSGVKTLINAGSDDLLLRPFSPAALQERVVTLVQRRKPFVVTSDYIGPDRRSEANRPANAKCITAPNALKAAASGDAQAIQRHRTAVSATRAEVDRERLRKLAMRISTAAQLQLTAGNAPGGANEAMESVELVGVARELHGRLGRLGRAEPLELSSTLCVIVERMAESGRAESHELELMRDLPLGVYAALEGDGAAANARGEIDMVLSKVRARFVASTEDAPSAAAG